MAEFNGIVSGEGRRYAVLASRFNNSITSKLADGAMDALVRHGCASEDIDVIWVPGAWELPFAARRLAATERYNALIVVGAVIRGGTPHFEYVCEAATLGLTEVSVRSGVPVGFGVLTCDTMAQALARAGGDAGNKGHDATDAALDAALQMRGAHGGP